MLAALLAITLVPFEPSALGEILRLRLLPRESQILTEISDPFGQTVTGEFTLQEGEARGEIKDLKGAGWVRLTIDAASYNSKLGLRDQDVQDNYLEVKDYPVIVFTSTGVEDVKEARSPKETWQFTVRGILDLHGIKREIRVPVRLAHRERKIMVEGSTKILLKDFNIAVPSFLFFRSGDQVEVKFRFMGEQQP